MLFLSETNQVKFKVSTYLHATSYRNKQSKLRNFSRVIANPDSLCCKKLTWKKWEKSSDGTVKKDYQANIKITFTKLYNTCLLWEHLMILLKYIDKGKLTNWCARIEKHGSLSIDRGWGRVCIIITIALTASDAAVSPSAIVWIG